MNKHGRTRLEGETFEVDKLFRKGKLIAAGAAGLVVQGQLIGERLRRITMASTVSCRWQVVVAYGTKIIDFTRAEVLYTYITNGCSPEGDTSHLWVPEDPGVFDGRVVGVVATNLSDYKEINFYATIEASRLTEGEINS